MAGKKRSRSLARWSVQIKNSPNFGFFHASQELSSNFYISLFAPAGASDRSLLYYTISKISKVPEGYAKTNAAIKAARCHQRAPPPLGLWWTIETFLFISKTTERGYSAYLGRSECSQLERDLRLRQNKLFDRRCL